MNQALPGHPEQHLVEAERVHVPGNDLQQDRGLVGATGDDGGQGSEKRQVCSAGVQCALRSGM